MANLSYGGGNCSIDGNLRSIFIKYRKAILIFDKTTKYIVMTKEEAFEHINSGKFTCGNFLIGDWAPNVRVIW